MNYGNNVLVAHVVIEGTRPMLWHRFGPEVLSLEKKERSGVAGNDPDEWRKTVLKTDTNQLYIEPSYIFACIREGAKYTKRGRITLQSAVSATLQVMDNIILINRFLPDEISNDINQPVYLDIRSVKNPITRARNIRYRVCSSPGWMANFNIKWDKTIISKNEMQAIIIDAGMYNGIGDARNIGFGRFDVNSFHVIENYFEKKNA